MSRSGWIRKSTRLAIYFRDGFRCVYCLADAAAGAEITLDHIDPAGGHDVSNLVTACHACNSTRRNRTPTAWYAVLRARGLDTTAIRQRIHRARRRKVNADLGAFAARILEHVAVGRMAALWPRTRRTPASPACDGCGMSLKTDELGVCDDCVAVDGMMAEEEARE